jgi:anti-sigma factor RsiW
MNMESNLHLTEDQISAALDGMIDDGTRQHLEDCAACQALLAEAGQRENTLMDILFRHDCPSPDSLRDFAMTLLGDLENAAVLSHLQDCALCRAELAEMRAFVNSDELALEEAPQAVSAKDSTDIFTQLGDLLLRGSTGRALPALRGEDQDLITFETEGFTMLIEIVQEAGAYAVMGQIIAANLSDWIGALVECRQEKQVRATAFVSEAGIFRCAPSVTGPINLRIIPESGRPIFVQDIKPGR